MRGAGEKPTTNPNNVCVEELSTHPDIDNEFDNHILGTIGHTDNLMATTGNNIVGTLGNADNIMAATTDE